jgi:hypothetical protein
MPGIPWAGSSMGRLGNSKIPAVNVPYPIPTLYRYPGGIITIMQTVLYHPLY